VPIEPLVSIERPWCVEMEMKCRHSLCGWMDFNRVSYYLYLSSSSHTVVVVILIIISFHFVSFRCSHPSHAFRSIDRSIGGVCCLSSRSHRTVYTIRI
jgi:hypothetical protein